MEFVRTFRVEHEALLHQENTSDLLHLLGLAGSELLRLGLTGGHQRDVDLLVDRDTRMARIADLAEGVVIQLAVDVEHEHFVNRGHGLFHDLLLQIKGGANNGDSVRLQVTAKLTRSGVHGDELLQFRTAIHDTVVGTKNEFKELRDGP